MLRWFGRFERMDNEKLMKQNRYKKEYVQQYAWKKKRVGRGVTRYYEEISRAAASRPPAVRDQKMDEEKGTLKITRSYGLLNLAINYGVTNPYLNLPRIIPRYLRCVCNQ